MLADRFEMQGDVASAIHHVGLGTEPDRRAQQVDRFAGMPEQRRATVDRTRKGERGRGHEGRPTQEQRAFPKLRAHRGQGFGTPLLDLQPTSVRRRRRPVLHWFHWRGVELRPERSPARGTARFDDARERQRTRDSGGPAVRSIR